MLKIKSLNVEVNGNKILKGVNLQIKRGEIHALMGPNGAGKTTLAMALINNSVFSIQYSVFSIDGKDIRKLKVGDVARAGLFVSFQQPVKIDGLTVFSFLRHAYKSLYPEEKKSITEFKKEVLSVFKKVGLSENFIQKYVNDGISGGEKKKFEAAQFLIFKPKFAILDEIDSGLDIDSLKKIILLIKEFSKKNKIGLIFITHNPRVFNFIKPDFIHVLKEGKIVKTKGLEIIKEIEKKGYDAI